MNRGRQRERDRGSNRTQISSRNTPLELSCNSGKVNYLRAPFSSLRQNVSVSPPCLYNLPSLTPGPNWTGVSAAGTTRCLEVLGMDSTVSHSAALVRETKKRIRWHC